MHQFTYTPESWAAQIKNPQNRMETVGPALCKAAGGKMIGVALLRRIRRVLIADVPDMESMAAIALAISGGGSVKSAKTTVLMTGAQGVEALKKAEKVAKEYKPAK